MQVVSAIVYIDEKSGEIIDAHLEKSFILSKAMTYEEANDVLSQETDETHVSSKTKATLDTIARLLEIWQTQRIVKSAVSRRREEKLQSRDRSSATFARSQAHRVVDSSLDLFSYVATKLLREKKAPVCRIPGSGAGRGGRLATAPLRRFIDGMAQKQIISILCGGSGIKRMTSDECRAISERSGRIRNAISASRFSGSKRRGGGKNY